MIDSLRLYFDRDRYGTEVLGKLAAKVLNAQGHRCRYRAWEPIKATSNVLVCDTCEICYHRWAIIGVFRRLRCGWKETRVLEELEMLEGDG
jgi:hypothetical protein